MKDPAKAPSPWDEAEILLAKYEHEPEHPRHVARLALQIFETLPAAQGWPERARLRLELGALLHDTGWSQSVAGKSHHKHSARLIRDYPWRSLPGGEVSIVAAIARYHRRALPDEKHAEWSALPGDARTEVMLLGGILRAADALDRSHRQLIHTVRAEAAEKRIILRLESAAPYRAESDAFLRKRDLLELALGQRVELALDGD